MRETIGKFSFELLKNDSLFIVTGAGEINFSESVEAIKYAANHPDFTPSYKLIVDLRSIKYHPSYADLLGIIDTLKFLKSKYKNRMAIVTDLKLEVVAKLVAIYCNQVGMQVKSFTSIEKAHSWIKE